MNSFGSLFRISIYGESHGAGVGIVIDGCPAGIPLSEDDFEKDMARRRAGAEGTTPRIEKDKPEILSGLFSGYTTGSPMNIFFRNTNTKSEDYNRFRDVPRPGHADLTAFKKYGGFNDPRGSGHFSGRITAGIVAAGVIAKKICDPMKISAELTEAGGSRNIEKAVADAVVEGDSIGGIVECRIERVQPGLGEPFFNSAESVISHLIFSVPGIRGIEFGSGFRASAMKGSEHNDSIIDKTGYTETNNHAGINGGITNGNNIYFRVAVKPTSTVNISQKTYDFRNNKMTDLKGEGRHDTCFALRIPIVIEAVSAIAMADLFLISNSQKIKGEKK